MVNALLTIMNFEQLIIAVAGDLHVYRKLDERSRSILSSLAYRFETKSEITDRQFYATCTIVRNNLDYFCSVVKLDPNTVMGILDKPELSKPMRETIPIASEFRFIGYNRFIFRHSMFSDVTTEFRKLVTEKYRLKPVTSQRGMVITPSGSTAIENLISLIGEFDFHADDAALNELVIRKAGIPMVSIDNDLIKIHTANNLPLERTLVNAGGELAFDHLYFKATTMNMVKVVKALDKHYLLPKVSLPPEANVLLAGDPEDYPAFVAKYGEQGQNMYLTNFGSAYYSRNTPLDDCVKMCVAMAKDLGRRPVIAAMKHHNRPFKFDRTGLEVATTITELVEKYLVDPNVVVFNVATYSNSSQTSVIQNISQCVDIR